MAAFQRMQLTFLLLVLVLTGVRGQSGRRVVTEKYTSQSSSSAYASASSSSSSTVTIHVTTEESSDEAQPEVSPKEKPAPTKAPVKPPPPPKNVTERIREAILNGSFEEVAWILVDETDITELAHGFKFPEDKRENYLIKTAERKTDPDVIALKGMAKAAVDHDIAKKLTEVFIVAIYGAGTRAFHCLVARCSTDFDTNVCPEEPQVTRSKTVKRNRTVTTTTYGYSKITNSSGTYTVYDEPQTETAYWENSYTTDGIDLEMEDEAMASLEAEGYDVVSDCYTEEEILTIRRRLLKDFSDKKLMREIVKGQPRPEVRPCDHSLFICRQGLRQKSRSLFVIGTPVSSWLCANCWKAKFCNKNVYWCPQ